MSKKEQVGSFVASRIGMLQNGSPWAASELAKLRRCAGKSLEEATDAWEVLFSEAPPEISPRTGNASPVNTEIASFMALTLFAVHQQGQNVSVNCRDRSFSSAVSLLVKNGSDSIRNRFNAVMTAQDLTELAHHMRGLIQIMRASPELIGFNYPRLAMDLYEFQFDDSKNKVRLRWAKDFYHANGLNKENKEGEKE